MHGENERRFFSQSSQRPYIAPILCAVVITPVFIVLIILGMQIRATQILLNESESKASEQKQYFLDRITALQKENAQTIADYNALVDDYDTVQKNITPPATIIDTTLAAVKPPHAPVEISSTNPTPAITAATPGKNTRPYDPTAPIDANYIESALGRTSGSSGNSLVGPRGGVYHYSASGKKVYSKK